MTHPSLETLLVVDDEPEILTALADLFEDDFRVLTASSGAEGLAILAREPAVQVIISDQRMPGMTGDVFLSRAREVSEAEALLLTGYADLNAVIGAVNNGRIAFYATKPWEPSALRNMVANAAARRRLARALATERALLHGLMDSSVDALSFKDRQGRFVRLNAAKAASLEQPIQNCLGRPETDFLSPKAKANLDRAEHEAMSTGRAIEVIEQRHQGGAGDGHGGGHSDSQGDAPGEGQPRWVRVSRIPIQDAEGDVSHLATVEHDITEQRGLEERLRQAEKMQALGTMAGGVAHDFNNLLTAILGNLDLLLRSGLPLPRQEMLARNAITAAERGAALTKRLLSFSRKRDLQMQAVDVNRLVQDMEDLLLRSLPDTLRLERVLDAGLWPALGDPEQLVLALLNLCINSRDAMPEGGGITLTTRNLVLADGGMPDLPPGDYVVIAVADTGSGMSAAVLGQAFEPFFTTKTIGKGTGLGLSMVYGLTRQSGGTTTIASTPGQGTTVELYLPRSAAMPEPAPGPEDAPPPTDRSMKILVVDDDPGVRAVTAGFLCDLGHRVVEVPDGEAALQVLRDMADIGALVTDLVMPGLSGGELARRARALRPMLPILLLSGYADPGAVPEGYPMLRKPFRQAELARSLAGILAVE